MLWNFEINHHPMTFIREITRYRASCTGLDIRAILQCMANYELVRDEKVNMIGANIAMLAV